MKWRQLKGARKAALPLMIDSVARPALKHDEEALQEYGIMIGKKIHDVAEGCTRYPRDIDEIGRFESPRSENPSRGGETVAESRPENHRPFTDEPHSSRVPHRHTGHQHRETR